MKEDQILQPGEKFNHWTVIGLDEDYEKKRKENKLRKGRRYICECDCENHTIRSVYGTNLRKGYSKSCGCLQKQAAQETGKNNFKGNKYDLSGEYGIGWTSNTNKEFYFDLEDYDKIKKYTWRETDWGYCLAYDIVNKKKEILMQYLVFNSEGQIIDHINRNRLDNRKENLRKCTQQENLRNVSLSTRNKSGFLGVYLNQNKKWVAQIKINKKMKYLGSFDNIEDAVITRLKAEKEYYGEFAPQRHLFEKYGII